MKQLLLLGALALAPRTADAFCGFYVAGGDQQMFNDATQVVLMRDGTRTVLAMQNNYKGPPQDFAMVIPVPTVLHEGDVKTLDKDVFARVEKMGAPRLVEYWEQDPCAPVPEPFPPGGVAMTSAVAEDRAVRRGPDLGVKIEAQFTVGEYDVVILSAKDSTGLETWLHQQKYTIPAGAEPLLRPYVEGGMKFFVAKVDPTKVKFVDGRAALSPLRFHYDTEDFQLPIRLGLANSSGTQDLIVNILALGKRYEVANYKNVFIPTNIDVDERAKDKFGAFYAALFDRTVEKHPGAVVTEYAWTATTCDPCPGPTLGPADFATLGADVLAGPIDKPTMAAGYDFVLTRLHARYGKSITDDLHFKEATPVVGGREFMQANGKLEEGARPDSTNNFQGRYAVRHAWTGAISCKSPIRNRWGGPGGNVPTTQIATDLAFAPRGELQLAQVVQRDVPEIDLKREASEAKAPVAPGSAMAPTAAPEPAKKKSGCGCATDDRNGASGLALLVGALFLARRRRT